MVMLYIIFCKCITYFVGIPEIGKQFRTWVYTGGRVVCNLWLIKCAADCMYGGEEGAEVVTHLPNNSDNKILDRSNNNHKWQQQ